MFTKELITVQVDARLDINDQIGLKGWRSTRLQVDLLNSRLGRLDLTVWRSANSVDYTGYYTPDRRRKNGWIFFQVFCPIFFQFCRQIRKYYTKAFK